MGMLDEKPSISYLEWREIQKDTLKTRNYRGHDLVATTNYLNKILKVYLALTVMVRTSLRRYKEG